MRSAPPSSVASATSARRASALRPPASASHRTVDSRRRAEGWCSARGRDPGPQLRAELVAAHADVPPDVGGSVEGVDGARPVAVEPVADGGDVGTERREDRHLRERGRLDTRIAPLEAGVHASGDGSCADAEPAGARCRRLVGQGDGTAEVAGEPRQLRRGGVEDRPFLTRRSPSERPAQNVPGLVEPLEIGERHGHQQLGLGAVAEDRVLRQELLHVVHQALRVVAEEEPVGEPRTRQMGLPRHHLESTGASEHPLQQPDGLPAPAREAEVRREEVGRGAFGLVITGCGRGHDDGPVLVLPARQSVVSERRGEDVAGPGDLGAAALGHGEPASRATDTVQPPASSVRTR